ncbi:hypothetical protein PFISCL1PPCAC_21145, partial [Pristionchus fissidentatus]
SILSNNYCLRSFSNPFYTCGPMSQLPHLRPSPRISRVIVVFLKGGRFSRFRFVGFVSVCGRLNRKNFLGRVVHDRSRASQIVLVGLLVGPALLLF